jgi:hypothetical protein
MDAISCVAAKMASKNTLFRTVEARSKVKLYRSMAHTNLAFGGSLAAT